MKKHNASRLLSGVKKVVTKTFFVTMTTNITRKEETKNHTENCTSKIKVHAHKVI